MKGATTMQRRINISLSEESIRLLDQLAARGNRSQYIERLVTRSAQSRHELRRLLKERAIRRAECDRRTATEWDPVADYVWRDK